MGGKIVDRAGSIDVALHEVSAEAGIGAERALQVDNGAFLDFPEGGDPERLGENVEAGGFCIVARDREAATVHRDGVSQSEFGGEGKAQSQLGLFPAFFQRENRAECFYESCEHGGGSVRGSGNCVAVHFGFLSGRYGGAATEARKEAEGGVANDRGDQGSQDKLEG